jgi:hypothetical protein
MLNRSFLTALLWIGCLLADDREAIRQARLEQNEAIAKYDAEHVVSFCTEDVTLRRGLGASHSLEKMLTEPSSI